MSTRIEAELEDYYRILERTQRGGLDITWCDGFEGLLTAAKYARIARCSSDTALRDIGDLVERGLLVRNAAGGRSTSYRMAD